MQELKAKLRSRVSSARHYFDEQRRQRIYNTIIITLGKLYIDACVWFRVAAFRIYVFIYWTLVSCCDKLFAGKIPRVIYADMDGVDITFATKITYNYPRQNTTNITLDDLLNTIDWFKGNKGYCCGNIISIYWLDHNDGETSIRLSKIDLTAKLETTTQTDILFGCINFSMLGSIRMSPQIC
ncbi:hypothetical protein D5b_00377 [Faustovirus]|nr:hypothetical protein D5b_00377 [Faustovirus]AMN84538.1 hypothetical protein D6_00130 [Faustovirus]AMP44320.1 hypothetical protein PRJ_Dakar_00368 [Faustovirus]